MVDLLLLDFRVFFGRRNDQCEGLVTQHARYLHRQLRKERMQQVRDYQPHQASVACHQRTGGKIGSVVQFLGALEDLSPSRSADVGIVAQRSQDGHHGDPEIARYILHSNHGLRPR